MKDWREPHESFLRVIRHTAFRLLHVRSAAYRGRRTAEAQRTVVHFYHNMRRIVFRTRGVVLISTPKSGRTWLRLMLDTIGIHIRYTHLSGRLEKPWDLKGRLIHLHRDPRDTVTSAWYQHRKRRSDFAGEFADFLRDPMLGLEHRVRFNLFWAECVAGNGGLVTSYERLFEDTPAELGRIVRFITGAAADDAKINQAVAAGTFVRMRALEASGEGAKLYGYALAPANAADPESYKTREGKIGSWREHFTEVDVAFANDIFENHNYFERIGDLTA